MTDRQSTLVTSKSSRGRGFLRLGMSGLWVLGFLSIVFPWITLLYGGNLTYSLLVLIGFFLWLIWGVLLVTVAQEGTLCFLQGGLGMFVSLVVMPDVGRTVTQALGIPEDPLVLTLFSIAGGVFILCIVSCRMFKLRSPS